MSLCDQAPLSTGFSSQEYWSGLPCPPPGNPNPGIEPVPFMSPAWAGRLFTISATWETLWLLMVIEIYHPCQYRNSLCLLVHQQGGLKTRWWLCLRVHWNPRYSTVSPGGSSPAVGTGTFNLSLFVGIGNTHFTRESQWPVVSLLPIPMWSSFRGHSSICQLPGEQSCRVWSLTDISCHLGVGVPGKISGSFCQMPIVPPVLPRNGSLGETMWCGGPCHCTRQPEALRWWCWW